MSDIKEYQYFAGGKWRSAEKLAGNTYRAFELAPIPDLNRNENIRN